MRLIGVVHLPALPGSPRSASPLEECIAFALADARALHEGGADAIIIENFHDYPFHAEQVPAHTVSAMTAAGIAIRREVPCAIGVNVLRNDAAAALSIAAAIDASFIRVNVHTGAMLTDQGIIEGRADRTMRLRRELGVEGIRVFADVLVKHAVALGPLTLEDAIRDATERGMADAIIVTGSATGTAASPEDVRRAVDVSSVPVYVGSGVTAANAGEFVPAASGVIVGSWLKRRGVVAEPIDRDRVRQLRVALDTAV